MKHNNKSVVTRLISFVIFLSIFVSVFANSTPVTSFQNNSSSYNIVIPLDSNLTVQTWQILVDYLYDFNISFRLNPFNPRDTVPIGPYNVSYIVIHLMLSNQTYQPVISGVSYQELTYKTLMIDLKINPSTLGISNQTIAEPVLPVINFSKLYIVFNEKTIDNNTYVEFKVIGRGPIHVLYYAKTGQFSIKLFDNIISQDDKNYTLYNIYIDPYTGYAYKLVNGGLRQLGYMPLYTVWLAYPKLRIAYVEASIYKGIYQYFTANPTMLEHIINYLRQISSTEGQKKTAKEVDNITRELIQENIINKYFTGKFKEGNYILNTTLESSYLVVISKLNETILQRLNKAAANIGNESIIVKIPRYNTSSLSSLISLLNDYFNGSINETTLGEFIVNNIRFENTSFQLRGYSGSIFLALDPSLYTNGYFIMMYVPFFASPEQSFHITVLNENTSLKRILSSNNLYSEFIRISSIPIIGSAQGYPESQYIVVVYNFDSLPVPVFNYNDSKGIQCRASLLRYTHLLLYGLLINATYDIIDYRNIPDYFLANITRFSMENCGLSTDDLNVSLRILDGERVNLSLLKSLYGSLNESSGVNNTGGTNQSSGNQSSTEPQSDNNVYNENRGYFIYLVPVLIVVISLILFIYNRKYMS